MRQTASALNVLILSQQSKELIRFFRRLQRKKRIVGLFVVRFAQRQNFFLGILIFSSSKTEFLGGEAGPCRQKQQVTFKIIPI